MNFYISLSKIRAKSPCEDGWKKLLAHLGKTKADDEPLHLLTVLESNGAADAAWCVRCLDQGPAVALAVELAEAVLPIFEIRFPGDDRPRKAIEAARSGSPAKADADAAANAAADATWATAYAAYAAAKAVDATARAVDAAAYAAAYAADATAYAAYATYAAWAAARAVDAAADAAYAAGAGTCAKNFRNAIKKLEARGE